MWSAIHFFISGKREKRRRIMVNFLVFRGQFPAATICSPGENKNIFGAKTRFFFFLTFLLSYYIGTGARAAEATLAFFADCPRQTDKQTNGSGEEAAAIIISDTESPFFGQIWCVMATFPP